MEHLACSSEFEDEWHSVEPSFLSWFLCHLMSVPTCCRYCEHPRMVRSLRQRGKCSCWWWFCCQWHPRNQDRRLIETPFRISLLSNKVRCDTRRNHILSISERKIGFERKSTDVSLGRNSRHEKVFDSIIPVRTRRPEIVVINGGWTNTAMTRTGVIVNLWQEEWVSKCRIVSSTSV